MPACSPDKEINPKTGRCIKKCGPGQIRNLETMRCRKITKSSSVTRSPPSAAPSNPCNPQTEEINPKTRRCMKKCGPGQYRNSQTLRCRKIAKGPSPVPPPPPPPPAETSQNMKKCADENKERNPKTGRCIKKCPPGQYRNINTMKCIKELPTQAHTVSETADEIKNEIKEQKKEEKEINNATVKVHRFPKDNNDTIVLFIKAHGSIIEKSKLNHKIYWHSHNPNNGCVVMNTTIDDKELYDIVRDLYQPHSPGEPHTDILTKYCNIINEKIIEYRSLKFLISYIIGFILYLQDLFKSIDGGVENKTLVEIESKGYMTYILSGKKMSISDETRHYNTTMDMIRDIEKEYNKIRNKSAGLKNKWEDLLNRLFLYKIYNKEELRNKPCNQFKRLVKDKVYSFNEEDASLKESFGIFDIYNTKKVNPLKGFYYKDSKRKLMFDKLGQFNLNTLCDFLKERGYNNIYIYELACNYNRMCNYNIGENQNIETLAKTLTVKTPSEAAAASNKKDFMKSAFSNISREKIINAFGR